MSRIDYDRSLLARRTVPLCDITVELNLFDESLGPRSQQHLAPLKAVQDAFACGFFCLLDQRAIGADIGLLVRERVWYAQLCTPVSDILSELRKRDFVHFSVLS